MSSWKPWCFLSLAVLLFLSISPTVTEVVNSMSDCNGFLLEGNSPDVGGILESGINEDKNRYKVICQSFKNMKRFVTLYDTTNRIPVFSAYKYNGTNAGRPDPIWKMEPQLQESPEKNMANDDGKEEYNHQASNTDYKIDKAYNRGHLFPSSYAFDKNDKISTFTLTNVVPQAVTFNSGSWAKMESCIKCILEKYCINNNGLTEGYIVTGAKAGTEKLNKRVNIPSVLWSAFCCYSNEKSKWLASAHWGKNTAEVTKDGYLPTKTLRELHDNLKIEAFPESKCPQNDNVVELYKNVNTKNCKCPP